MAKKHFDAYLAKVTSDYKNLLETLKAADKEAQEGLLPPERLDEVKSFIQPLLHNYERLLYVKLMMDMPARGKKQKRYKKECKIAYSEDSTEETVLRENATVLEQLPEVIKNGIA